MQFLSRKFVLGAGVLIVVLIGAIIVVRPAGQRASSPIVSGTATAASSVEERLQEQSVTPVNTIRPRHEPSFTLKTTPEPAYVEAYYRADLQAQVAGPVKFIHKAIGDAVTRGELLAEIDVPDRVQDVYQKEAVVDRCKMDLAVAQKQVAVAEAAAEVAQNTIDQKEAEVASAEATMHLRQLELKRIEYMVGQQAVYQQLADERKRDFEAAKEAHRSAQVAVKKANADWKEAKAKLDAVRADVNLKQALVEVARKDKDRAQALADYAKILAPFDGVITARNVDPGSFVQNASSAHTEPLLTVERTDIVTIYMKLPDNYAPLVRRDTDAIIELSELPGVLIHGKVTRFAPSLHAADRRMRMEMDLYNGSAREYQGFLTKEKATKFADLKSGDVPLLPQLTGHSASEQPHKLLPGMIGTMQLVLGTRNAYLIPSGAIFSQGGTPYIYVVRDGVAHLVHVEVQMDDGHLAAVVVISRVGNEEVKKALTGEEVIVASNQGELSDGQAVRSIPVEWK
jgi:multidrug efflux pump subunit AcrA (membrane-fusion protein)